MKYPKPVLSCARPVLASASESAIRPARLPSLRARHHGDEDESTGIPTSRGFAVAAARTPPRPLLTIMTGVRSGELVPLDGAADFFVGRSPSADIRFDEPGVSRIHCRVVRDDDGFFVEDLGSTNGTYVNGTQVGSMR